MLPGGAGDPHVPLRRANEILRCAPGLREAVVLVREVDSKGGVAEQRRYLHLPIVAAEAVGRIPEIVRDDERARYRDGGQGGGQRPVVDVLVTALRFARDLP